MDKQEDLEQVTWHLKIAVLFQSTVTYDDYTWAMEALAAKCYDLRVIKTICEVTLTRQRRSEEVARQVEQMIVIGGKNSSNTRKLVDVCSRYCTTHHIQEPEEVDALDLGSFGKIGITTGTSTPDFLVGRVIDRLKARA